VNKRTGIFTGIFVSLSIISCVPNSYNQQITPVSLLQKSRPHLKTTRVIVGLDPKNTNNFIAQQAGSSGQQYGLLGVLIESAMLNVINSDKQKQAQLMSPIRTAAIDFNFGSQFRGELAKKIRKVDWLKTSSVSKAPGFQRFNAGPIIHETEDDSVLVSDVFYKMEEDFSKMTFTSIVTIYPKKNALKVLAKKSDPESEHPVLYQNKFVYTYNYEKNYQSSHMAAQGWASNNAAMVHRALENGVINVTKLITKDLHI